MKTFLVSEGSIRSYPTSLDALMVAIRECKAEGGGTVWVHRANCNTGENSEDCPCDPIPFEVEPELSN